MMKRAVRLTLRLSLGSVVAVSMHWGTAQAQEAAELPRILILPQLEEAALPGDRSGAAFGVKVNRGPGFPAPALAVTVEPGTVEPVVQAEPAPAPKPVRILRRPKRGW